MAPEQINIAVLPSLPFAQRGQLPNIAGLYFVLGQEQAILYIGRAKSLCFRWQTHHRMTQFSALPDVRIAWFAVEDESTLDDLETKAILYFEPAYNGPRYQAKGFLFGQKKEATSVRLTPDARTLLQRLSDALGLSQAAVLETLIREKAKREQVTIDQARQRREATV